MLRRKKTPTPTPKATPVTPPSVKSFDIIFEDDAIVVVNKPANLLTLPDRFSPHLPNLRTMLVDKYGEIFVIHRLDKETSGVMVFAKDAESHRNLNQQFEDHTVDKLYYGIVGGIFNHDVIDIDIPMAQNPKKLGLMMPTARGKEALTIVRCLEKFRTASFVECRLKTGRQHQIRVHLSSIGHPLLVDKDYNDVTAFYVSSVKKNYRVQKNTDEIPILTRTPLHAWSLSFTHPKTNEQVTFTCEMPKDMRATLQVLRKYSQYTPLPTMDFDFEEFQL
ncbi:MAG: RluA family pseudouridine synthase [Candidatus Kapabacteria bacterium]|jgi:RluA family pseudouridine synthase|nr:RluA family pseudouridine synthase [Candidatus Kapabacteria bacterium]